MVFALTMLLFISSPSPFIRSFYCFFSSNSFFWANHVVHHRPQVFNFSVGLRSPIFHLVFSFFIHLPAAFLGFSPETYIGVFIFHTSYQLLNHTHFLKTPPLFIEKIFVTPSHHRVHHGRNHHYVNKNFGAVFSFWDIIFKTYQKENEKILYGVKSGELDLNPLTSNMRPLFNFFGLKTPLSIPSWILVFNDKNPWPKLWAFSLSLFSIVLTFGFIAISAHLAWPLKTLIVAYLFCLFGLAGSALNKCSSS